MDISPLRRSRILKAHELRQNGDSPRSIATALNISQATLLADLRCSKPTGPKSPMPSPTICCSNCSRSSRLDSSDSPAQDPPLPLEHIAVVSDQGDRAPGLEERPASRDFARLVASHDNAIAATLHEIRQTIREIERTNAHFPSGDDQLTDAATVHSLPIAEHR